MPKPTKGPRLGGGPAHERLMLANLAAALFTHKSIKTTETKAKRLRPLAERLVTFAKRGDLHARRRVLGIIGDKSVVHELFTEIAPLVAEREGGYTRITKLGFRKGDNAPMAQIELVLEPVTPKVKSTKSSTTAAPKAAPSVEEAPVEETVDETPPRPRPLRPRSSRRPRPTPRSPSRRRPPPRPRPRRRNARLTFSKAPHPTGCGAFVVECRTRPASIGCGCMAEHDRRHRSTVRTSGMTARRPAPARRIHSSPSGDRIAPDDMDAVLAAAAGDRRRGPPELPDAPAKSSRRSSPIRSCDLGDRLSARAHRRRSCRRGRA